MDRPPRTSLKENFIPSAFIKLLGFVLPRLIGRWAGQERHGGTSSVRRSDIARLSSVTDQQILCTEHAFPWTSLTHPLASIHLPTWRPRISNYDMGHDPSYHPLIPALRFPHGVLYSLNKIRSGVHETTSHIELPFSDWSLSSRPGCGAWAHKHPPRFPGGGEGAIHMC